MSTVQDLLARALRLPKKDRAGLAYDLLQSLEGNASMADTEWEETWPKKLRSGASYR